MGRSATQHSDSRRQKGSKMALSKLGFSGALLLAAGATMAAPATVPLSPGARTNPQTSVIGGDVITTLEIDDAIADDGEDAGPLAVDGSFSRAAVNRAVGAFEGVPAREARDSRRASANPQVLRSFNGVNFFDQRFSNNGNQFSV